MTDKIILESGHLAVSNNPIIPFIEGDGVGRDIWEDVRAVFDAATDKAYQGQKKVEWLELSAGKKVHEATGERLPEATLETIKEDLVAIKGPLETPVGSGVRSLNVTLRQELDLYACVRSVRYFKGIESPLKKPEKTSITIFRENTRDIYAGVEWNAGVGEVRKVIDFSQNEMSVSKIRFPETSSIGVKPISQEGSGRLIRSAVEYALTDNLTEVTLVHKGNIQEFTEGSFRSQGYDLAKRECTDELASGKLVTSDIIADNFLRQILLNPEGFDVAALTNLNGDYASDALATQVGGIRISPGANIDYLAGHTVFGTTYGTAPGITGRDITDPCFVFLSGYMLLNYIGWTEVTSLITAAIEKAFARDQFTAGLAQGKVACSTSEFVAELIENL